MSDLQTREAMLRAMPPAELPWIEFELPAPPSVNEYDSRQGNSSPVVRKWIKRADMAFLLIKREKFCRIKGKFEAEFHFGRDTSDYHNREKSLWDWLQSREWIENDKLSEWRGSGWSDAVMKGRVIVRLRPWMNRT